MHQASFVFVRPAENEKRAPTTQTECIKLLSSSCGQYRTKKERRQRKQNGTGLIHLRAGREQNKNDDDTTTRMDQVSAVFVRPVQNERRTPTMQTEWIRLLSSSCGQYRTKGERQRNDQNASGFIRLRAVGTERKENDDDATRIDQASFVFLWSVENERRMMTTRPEWMK